MRCSKTILMSVLLGLLMFSIGLGEVPRVISYQGRLTDTGGDPVTDGPYLIKFKIYGSEAGVDSVWWSGFQTIQVTGGLFSYDLGSGVVLPETVFQTDTARYLGITVGTDAEIVPRSKLTSVGFAYQTLRADVADEAEGIDCNGCVTSTELAPDAVHETHIANASVTDMKIASNAVGEDQINQSEVQVRVHGSCPPGSYIRSIDPDGAVICETDEVGDGDITAVYTTDGLTGGGDVGDLSLSIDDYGVSNQKLAYGSVSSDKIVNNTIMTEDLGDNCVNGDKIANYSISNEDLTGSCVASGNIVNQTIMAEDLGVDCVTSDKIEDDAVYDDKIEDEPGIAHEFDHGGFYVDDANVTAGDTITVTVPRSGYLVIHVSGFFYLSYGGSGSNTYMRASISVVATNLNYDNFAIWDPRPSSTVGMDCPFSIIMAKAVSAGSHTYYLTGDCGSDCGASSAIQRTHMLAVYYPSSYGDVANTKDVSENPGNNPAGTID